MTARTFTYGDIQPLMIGFVPRTRPTIAVERYSADRLALVHSCERQSLIEAIARHLQAREGAGMSLRDMYA